MRIDTTSLSALTTAFNAAFTQGLGVSPPVLLDLAMTVNSETAEEQYGWLGHNTAFREWLGDRVVQNMKSYGFTLRNKKFENTVGVSADDIEDNKLQGATIQMKQLGQDTTLFPDKLLGDLIAAGGSSLAYDGQYFFDTDHPVNGASVANLSSGAGAAWYLLDTSKVIKPFVYQLRRPFRLVAKTEVKDDNVFWRDEYVWGVDGRCNAGYGLWQLAFKSTQVLDETHFSAARAAMLAFKNDKGLPLNVMPNILLVGPSNEVAARKLMNATTAANGATNIVQGLAKVVVSPFLA
jgi:phage major head subunit gpT-like protein